MRRRSGLERSKKLSTSLGYLRDRALKYLAILFRRLLKPADFPDELQGSGVEFVPGWRLVRSSQNFDASAHLPSSSRRSPLLAGYPRSARGASNLLKVQIRFS